MNTKFKKPGVLLAGFLSGALFVVLSVSTAYASPATCTWTGSSSLSWATAANWNCTSGTVPGNGYDVIFDTDLLSGNAGLNNNLIGLSLNNIEFTGSNPSWAYELMGNPISLSGGVTDISSGGNYIYEDLTLTANQTFSSEGHLNLYSSIDLGSHTLNVSGDEVDFFGSISGSGTINSGADTVDDLTSSHNFTGEINITRGQFITVSSYPDAIGTSRVTIFDGGTWAYYLSGGTFTVSNPLTLGGNGYNGSGQLYVNGLSPGDVDFTGPVTLKANSAVSVVAADVTVDGAISGCGYSLSLLSGSTGTLNGNLSQSCTQSTGNTGNNTSSGSLNFVKPPATGYGEPSRSNSIIMAILAGAVVSLGAGSRLLYHRKQN